MKTFAFLLIVFLAIGCMTLSPAFFGFFLSAFLLTLSVNFLYTDYIKPLADEKRVEELKEERRKRILNGDDIIQTIFKDVDEYDI